MNEVKHNNVKYPSTNQFRNVIQHITKAERFCGVDENNNAIYDSFKTLPTIPYIATVKLHGTNGSMIMFEDQTIYFQSKERLLSFGYDNAGFWEHMQRTDKTYLFDLVKEKYLETHQELKYPIIIAGEWCGKGIQKSVAVSELNKMFVVFGVKVGEDWQPQEEYSHISNHTENIYNTLEFPHWEINIDFNKPGIAQAQIIDLTLKVEQECPVGKHFGVSGIGEGVVLKPKDGKYCSNSGSWFKSKGEKHSSSKVKKLAAVDTEKLANIQEFIDYTVTESRLNQMLVEVKPETLSQIGECIKWMKSDIIKEESDTMADNNLEMKDCGQYITQKVKDFVIKSLS